MPSYGPTRGGRIPTWVKPPKEAQRIARAALRRRRKLPMSKRGGLDADEARAQGVTSGVLRAESIAKGQWQPAEDVNAFFQRFKGTYQGAQDKPWDDSKVQQAWDLWGGDAMWRVAQKALRTENPAQFKEYELHATERAHKNEWDIEAYLPGWKKVGDAEFVGVYEYDDEGQSELVALKGWNIEIHPDHRRKGLASAMYRFAEEVFGLPVRPGDIQTEEGAQFVLQRKNNPASTIDLVRRLKF